MSSILLKFLDEFNGKKFLKSTKLLTKNVVGFFMTHNVDVARCIMYSPTCLRTRRKNAVS